MKNVAGLKGLVETGKKLITDLSVRSMPQNEKPRNITIFLMMAVFMFFAMAPECYADASLSSLKTGFSTVLNVIMGGAFIWGTIIIIMGMNGQGGSPDWGVVIKGAMIAGSTAIMLVLYNVFNVAGDAVPNM